MIDCISLIFQITIHSFNLVGSVSYLLDISNFFQLPPATQNAPIRRRTQMGTVVEVDSNESRMSVYLSVEKPDIFLVENIEDVNTDALMLNTELQIKYWLVTSSSNSGQMSVLASLTDICCHTCRYNPDDREGTMTQILKPCTLSFSVNQQNGHGMRINVNISDMILNVSPYSIQIIRNSVQTFLESMTKDAAGEDVSSLEKQNLTTIHEEDYSDLWTTQQVNEDQLWFLKHNCEQSMEVTEATNLDSFSTNSAANLDEQAVIKINNLIVVVEAGVGANTMPLLLVESSLNFDVRNWSGSRLNALGSVNLEVAYYNTRLALWEPVVERVVVKEKNQFFKKRWDMNVAVQCNSQNDIGSAFLSPSFEETDGFVTPHTLPPLMALSIQSRDVLEITVTKMFVNVLKNLNESFNQEYIISKKRKKDLPIAPFVVKNNIGKSITVILEAKQSQHNYKYFVKGDVPGRCSEVKVDHQSEIHLVLTKERTKSQVESGLTDYVSPLREQTEQAEITMRLRVSGEKGSFDIPISKSDRRFFAFPYRGDESGNHHGMVSEIEVANGSKTITLRSIIKVKNHYSKPVDLYKTDAGASTYNNLATILPQECFYVPVSDVYQMPYDFYFRIHGTGESIGLESFTYSTQSNDKLVLKNATKSIECSNRNGEPQNFVVVDGSTEDIFLGKTGKLESTIYTMDIRPMFVLKNCLSVPLFYAVRMKNDTNFVGKEDMFEIQPGHSSHLQGVVHSHTKLVLRISEYGATEWMCEEVVQNPNEMAELSTWRFFVNDPYDQNAGSASGKLDLGVNCNISSGTQVLSIFAPFWMINKTGKLLTYRGQDPQNIVYHHNALSDVPMMFSYTTSKGIFGGKRKACLRIEESGWSESFTLDAIEDAGKVTCKRPSGSRNDPYQLGVNINMSKSSLTKIITLTPFYMIQNTTDFAIEIFERETPKNYVVVEPGETEPFWPDFGAQKVCARVGGTPEVTAPFSMQKVHSSLLMLANKYGGLHVEVRASSSETLLSVSAYKRGKAPVQLINYTDDLAIQYQEKGTDCYQILSAKESVYFTWTDPEGCRCIVWSIVGQGEEYENELTSDGQNYVELELDRDGNKAFLGSVSFLDGMQRVLLFCTDPGLCLSLAHSTGENERISQEVDISIFGIGLSVVNNCCANGVPNYELIYMSISSSDVVWEIRKQGKSRYKPLTVAQCDAIEEDFAQYSRDKTVGKRTSDSRKVVVESSTKEQQILVNYADCRMSAPYEGKIRRQFQKGLWLQVRTSDHQWQIHAKINRVQIDNQLPYCMFPVIMAPVPQPRSVTADSIPKPFMELSVLEYHNTSTDMRQFKMIHALVQELSIKIDHGLITALNDLLEEEEILDENIHEFLTEDLTLAARPLKDVATLRVTQGQRDFFDFIHLSPLKVHVSFSLTSYNSSKNKKVESSSRRSNFFGLFLQSLGVPITDTDDIIFRLAYFERKHSFYTQNDLFSEMIRHYTSQAIKQAYVIVFGLDVIGNPFGLVVGVSRSVEDLFYEPFLGAVEGPSEFAEGLKIGVRSVFSGVVGGAAGTVSKITGAIGKGLASLTFDEKFQAKRREAIKKRGRQNFGESLARSGRGLVMGVFDGVTGVALKPIEGAKEEGVGGFFKGVGKGVVGLVARPTGGIVDFASGTFDSVKRVTEVTQEISRVRPPRFLNPDGVVRYFDLKSANGSKYLRELEKGKYAETDLYVAHEVIEAADRSVFLVSNKRLLYIVYQPVLGQWAVDWEFTFSEITGPPPVEKDTFSDTWYLIIRPKEEKRKVLGLFGGVTGKKITMANRDQARNLARIIEKLRSDDKP